MFRVIVLEAMHACDDACFRRGVFVALDDSSRDAAVYHENLAPAVIITFHQSAPYDPAFIIHRSEPSYLSWVAAL